MTGGDTAGGRTRKRAGGYRSAAYSAAKAGVINLTRTVALEYARYGIRVNCMCPGVIQTPLLDQVQGGSDIDHTRLFAMQPMPRLGEPEDIA